MINFFAILVSITLFVNGCTAANLVCFFTSWTVYRPGNGKYNVSNLPADLCTHVNYGFVGLQEWDGSLSILDDWEANGLYELDHLKALRVKNPDLKLVVSMGGWNEGSEKYSHVAADPKLRKNMVDSVLEFLDKYEFDGFDLDWEYPDQRGGEEEDIENFITLLQEFKQAFAPKNYILSVDVSGGVVSANTSYHIKELGEAVDMINVMAYDYHGAFEDYVGHYAPLYASHMDESELQRSLNVKSGIEFWLSRGAPAEKLNLGIGTYGRGFTLADPKNISLYAPMSGPCTAGPYTREAGTIGYNEICELYSDYTYYWDDEQKVPHIVKGNQWIGYDNALSVQYKVEFAKSKGLGGVMTWSLDTDDFRGICGDGKYPLIRVMKKLLNQ
ncbi:chitotriosidase-1-like [Coccinella septempunctata]|uniref:chitotriosidase-1-like n=1 Tax=Coccinella septempunctata TaxID=41139 RepID=UPI001D062D89|nr:chitotriosidase-1-like [Coccinella septempunctata]